MRRLRSVLFSLPVLVLVSYSLVGLLIVGLGYVGAQGGARFVIAVIAALVLFVLTGFGVVAVLGIEEDWWNDFRETNVALIVAAICQFALLPKAWFLGSGLH